MHTEIETINPKAFVSHQVSFHQSAAMYAANMVKFQYTKESKSKFRRECLDHLKASLASGKGASA